MQDKLLKKPGRSPWEKKAANLLKAEITRRGMTNQDLKEALAKIGVEKTLGNLIKTINMGKFPFAFFLQCAQAIGLNKLHLNDD